MPLRRDYPTGRVSGPQGVSSGDDWWFRLPLDPPSRRALRLVGEPRARFVVAQEEFFPYLVTGPGVLWLDLDDDVLGVLQELVRRNHTLRAGRELTEPSDSVRRFRLQYGDGGMKHRVDVTFAGGILDSIRDSRPESTWYTVSYGRQRISAPRGELLTEPEGYVLARHWVDGDYFVGLRALQTAEAVQAAVRKRPSANPVRLIQRQARKADRRFVAVPRVRIRDLADGVRFRLVSPYGRITCKVLWDRQVHHVRIDGPIRHRNRTD